MEPKRYRWSKVYESSEEELLLILKAKNLLADRCSIEAGSSIEPSVHPTDLRLWCAEGDLLFTVNQKKISIQAGDTLDIPANTYYEARAGLGGCVWYQRT